MGLALGYEDINDHDRLRDATAPASGCAGVTGAGGVRERDRVTRWPRRAR